MGVGVGVGVGVGAVRILTRDEKQPCGCEHGVVDVCNEYIG